MVTAKKSSKKKVGSREDLIKLLNFELLKIEAKFIDDTLGKFREIVENYSLPAEDCVDLLKEDRSDLGSLFEDRFFTTVINQVYDSAEGQHETDIDNGDDCGFYFAFTSAMDKYPDYIHEEIRELKSS